MLQKQGGMAVTLVQPGMIDATTKHTKIRRLEDLVISRLPAFARTTLSPLPFPILFIPLILSKHLPLFRGFLNQSGYSLCQFIIPCGIGVDWIHFQG
jgi:hypothetical protein